jgi:mannose-6-phosphate isomerase-like protein (cupin superfamily)
MHENFANGLAQGAIGLETVVGFRPATEAQAGPAALRMLRRQRETTHEPIHKERCRPLDGRAAQLAAAHERRQTQWNVPKDSGPAASATIHKAWGAMRTIYRDRRHEVVQFSAVDGGYSSLHRHRHKDNTFAVVRGCLALLILDADDCPREVLVVDGGIYTVPAPLRHRFVSLGPTTGYEVYAAVGGHAIDPGDIIRADQGGLLDGDFRDQARILNRPWGVPTP